MRNVLKKMLDVVLLPLILLGKVFLWPFRRKPKAIQEPSITEQIAQLIPEGVPYKPEKKVRVHYGSSYTCIRPKGYDEANRNCIKIKDWSFAPIVGSGDGRRTRKIMNRWRWRLGEWSLKEAENKTEEADE